MASETVAGDIVNLFVLAMQWSEDEKVSLYAWVTNEDGLNAYYDFVAGMWIEALIEEDEQRAERGEPREIPGWWDWDFVLEQERDRLVKEALDQKTGLASKLKLFAVEARWARL